MRRFLLGATAGAVLGYTLVRAAQSVGEVRAPAVALEPDPARYGAARRASMLIGLARSLGSLAVVAFGLAPLFESPGLPEPRPRRLGLIAAGLALATLVDLPVEFVEGFALERQYGLSKQTPEGWLRDQLKANCLSLAIGVPLLELLATVVARAPRTWPLAATALTPPLLALAGVVAPTFVLPLFNRFEPVEGPLEARIRTLASRYGAANATILRVDMSRQTEKANAYVAGLFGMTRIVLGDTLLDRFPPNETLFVVAHELGHYVRRDVWRNVAAGTLAAAVVFAGGRVLADRRDRSLASSAGLARLAWSISLLGTLAGVPLAAFSRANERAADEFALSATGDADAGAAAFERLRERNAAEAEQPRWMEVLFATHPSLRSRIERLRAAG